MEMGTMGIGSMEITNYTPILVLIAILIVILEYLTRVMEKRGYEL